MSSVAGAAAAPLEERATAAMLLADVASRGATLWGGRPALLGAGVARSHAELADRVSRIAAVMDADGVRAGTRVAVLSPNVPEVVEADLAIARLGAVLVPLNIRLTADDLRFQVNDAEVTHAVVHPRLDSLAAASGLGARRCWLLDADLDRRLSAQPPTAVPRPGPDALFMQLYTSGTTGRPKGCLLSQSAWLASNANLIHGLRLEHGERLLAVYPLYHVAGFGMAVSVLTLGGAVVFAEGASPDELWPLVERFRVTRTGLPGLRAQLDSEAAARADSSSLRGVIGGANMEGPRTLERFREALPRVGFHGVYGSTEAGNLVTVDSDLEELERPGTIGRPLPGFDVRIAGPDDEPVAPGEAGELCLRGPSTMSGYWRLPEATATALRGGWVHTDDVVRADDDGYLFLVDRLKDMIKSGGENVYSIEVESVLLRHPGVADVAVVGVPDRRWGEAVKAIVVVAPAASPTPEELDAFCRERLAAYKRPRWYELVPVIARSQTGKIVKRELRDAHDPTLCTRLAETA